MDARLDNLGRSDPINLKEETGEDMYQIEDLILDGVLFAASATILIRITGNYGVDISATLMSQAVYFSMACVPVVLRHLLFGNQKKED